MRHICTYTGAHSFADKEKHTRTHTSVRLLNQPQRMREHLSTWLWLFPVCIAHHYDFIICNVGLIAFQKYLITSPCLTWCSMPKAIFRIVITFLSVVSPKKIGSCILPPQATNFTGTPVRSFKAFTCQKLVFILNIFVISISTQCDYHAAKKKDPFYVVSKTRCSLWKQRP